MVDGINKLIQAFGYIFNAIFTAPLYGSMTWGYFLVAVAIMDIVIVFFISKLK